MTPLVNPAVVYLADLVALLVALGAASLATARAVDLLPARIRRPAAVAIVAYGLHIVMKWGLEWWGTP